MYVQGNVLGKIKIPSAVNFTENDKNVRLSVFTKINQHKYYREYYQFKLYEC